MSVKKVVISPDNTKALAFFDDLNRRKEAMLKRIEDNPIVHRVSKVVNRANKQLGSYYSYLKEIDDQDAIFYIFRTSQNLLYTVYFDAYQYQDYLEHYPTLLNSGYAFGFFRIGPAPKDKKIQDELIFPTIHKIVLDFIEEYGNLSVLLYHCDSKDKKHPYRNKLFQNWEKALNEDKSICRTSLKAQIGDDPQDYHHFVYMGIIADKSNPLIEKVKEEFEAFSIDLALMHNK